LVPALKTPDASAWRHWQTPGHLAERGVRPAPRAVNPFVLLPVLALVVLAAGMGFIAQRVHVMEMGYQLRALNQELARLQDEHRRLEVELVRARSPERVESLARTRLNMVEPGRPQLVVLPPTGPVDGPALSGGGAPSLGETLASHVAAVGDWLLERFTAAAEAGSRRP